jgi:hypothetical protein
MTRTMIVYFIQIIYDFAIYRHNIQRRERCATISKRKSKKNNVENWFASKIIWEKKYFESCTCILYFIDFVFFHIERLWDHSNIYSQNELTISHQKRIIKSITSNVLMFFMINENWISKWKLLSSIIKAVRYKFRSNFFYIDRS